MNAKLRKSFSNLTTDTPFLKIYNGGTMSSVTDRIPHQAPLLGQVLQEEQANYSIPAAISAIIQALATSPNFMQHAVIQTMLEKEGKPVDSFNATGDRQQKLDLLAHDFFVKALDNTQEVCAIISEEADSLVPLTHSQAPYIVAMDPLDGSANVPINGPIGTLFSIYPRRTAPDTPLQEADVLVPGHQQVAAGYILYSTAIVLVYATPHRVHGFTYDPDINDFVLTHPSIYMPESGLTYALNHSYLNNFPHYIQNYIAYCRRQELSCRYTGALVADFHRHLLEGGIYLYPPTLKRPNGKLRLMFECNVLAFIAEQAGGMASDGKQPILQIMPRSLHQCVPFYIGSKGMIQPLLALANK